MAQLLTPYWPQKRGIARASSYETEWRPIICKKTSVTGRQERPVRLQKVWLYYHYPSLIQKRMSQVASTPDGTAFSRESRTAIDVVPASSTTRKCCGRKSLPS